MTYMYCEHKGNTFIFFSRSLHESLLLEFVMIIIIFCLILNILMLDVELPQKIIP